MVKICNGTPIRNIIHKVFGGVVRAYFKVKYTARITVQTKNEVQMELNKVFPHTDVNTKRTINVIGMAYINDNQVVVINGKIKLANAKNTVATNHTKPAAHKAIIQRFLPRFR